MLLVAFIYKKNDFAEISKNLAKYRSENNFVESSKIYSKHVVNNAAKNVNIVANSLSVLRNYFDSFESKQNFFRFVFN